MRNNSKAGLDYLLGLSEWKGDLNFDLRKIRAVLERLGAPQDSLPIVHIAGTNGKGSVSAAVASMLGAAGFSVGLNISPHLSQINERIILNGRPIESSLLGEVAFEVSRVCGDVVLSFHEAVTAAAFLTFREVGLDWAVVEVGLGGRLDSSNVIKEPAATGIVSISFDHEHVLGGTLEAIAFEKAGIIKPNRPCVTGRLTSSVLKVIDTVCREKNAPMSVLGRDFTVHSTDCSFEVISEGESIQFRPSLKGEHQVENMAVAARIGQVVGLSAHSITRGLEGVYWPGRLEETYVNSREVLFDCAHNPAGVAALVAYLNARGEIPDICFGALRTKDWRQMIANLIPSIREWHLLQPISSVAESTSQIAEFLSGFGIKATDWGANYRDFLDFVVGGDRPLLVCGSMYLVGHMRELMGVANREIWKKL